jgi:hypothetical protein
MNANTTTTTTTISNMQDIIDSRDIIARIEELNEQQTERFVAGFNMPGYMPDSEPGEFESFEDAKQFIIDLVKAEEDSEEDESKAEALCHAAEEINLESSEFSVRVGNYVYWVTKDGVMGLDEEEQEELEALEALAAQCEGYGDWEHGEALIRGSYFEEYAQELAEDIGAIDRNASWPNTCIDWEQAARELAMDYTQVDFDGVTYLMRA